MDNKRGMEEAAPIGEVVDVRSGMPESLEMARETREVPAGAEKMENVADVGQERMVPAAMPPAAEKAVEEQGLQDELQGDLVNITTRDGEKIEKEWAKKTDELMDKTEDNPRARLATFDVYRWKYLGKRHNRVREGVN